MKSALTLDDPTLRGFLANWQECRDESIPLIASDWLQEQGATDDDMRRLFLVGLPVEILIAWLEHAGHPGAAWKAKQIKPVDRKEIGVEMRRSAENSFGYSPEQEWRFVGTNPTGTRSIVHVPRLSAFEYGVGTIDHVVLNRQDYVELADVGPFVWRKKLAYWLGVNSNPQFNEILWMNYQPDLDQDGRDYARDVLFTFTPYKEVMELVPEEEMNTAPREPLEQMNPGNRFYLTPHMVRKGHWIDLLRQLGVDPDPRKWSRPRMAMK